MNFEFLQPISNELETFVNTLSNQSIGKKIAIHTQTDFPILKDINIALITVNEHRGIAENTNYTFDAFRKSFYKLFSGNWQNVKLADLGTIEQGNTLEDSYFILKEIVTFLIKQNCIPLIIGGSQDLTYAMYRAYDQLDRMVNLVSVDAEFDFAKDNKDVAHSYLSKIIVNEPNNLFNYSNLAYQTYLNSQEEIDLIEKLYFEAYRLGEINQSLSIAEPVLRDADLVSIDINAVQSNYTGNTKNFNPNGLDGKEICALTRYAGLSDKTSAIGIFNSTHNVSEVNLLAQMVWYFIEGVAFRSNEYPFESKINYIKYNVLIEDEELIFYKSNKTQRWWIEIPIFTSAHNKLKKVTLLPCTHNDYLAACNNEIPLRWWKAQKRNLT